VKNPQRDVTEGNYMAAAENSRMLRVVASVPVLSFPPPPKPSPLCFHRAYLSLLDDKTLFEIIRYAHIANQSPFCLVYFSVLSGLRFNSAVLLVFLRQDESA